MYMSVYRHHDFLLWNDFFQIGMIHSRLNYQIMANAKDLGNKKNIELEFLGWLSSVKPKFWYEPKRIPSIVHPGMI